VSLLLLLLLVVVVVVRCDGRCGGNSFTSQFCVCVCSSALTLGDAATKPALLVFSAASVGAIGAAGVSAGLSAPFFVALGAGHAQYSPSLEEQ
jgi:hypothetical protein